MLNFSENAWKGRKGRARERRLEEAGDEVRRAGWTFYGFPLSHSEAQVGVGKCSSDIVFPFHLTKAPWSNFANATKSGRASYLLSVAVILLGTFARVGRHSLNCRRERRRRRRRGILEQATKKTYSFGFAVYRAITFLCCFIRYSNAISMPSSHRSQPGNTDAFIIQYKRSAFDSVCHQGIFEIFHERKLIQHYAGFEI